MIISYQGHKPINVAEGKITLIKIGSRDVYREFITSLNNGEGELQIYDDEYNKIELTKAIDWIGDVLLGNTLDKYMTKVQNQLAKNILPDNLNKIQEKWEEIMTVVQDAVFMEDLPLEVNLEADIKKIIKLGNLSFTKDILESPYDIIESVLKIHQGCNFISVVALTNLYKYLNGEQQIELSKFVKNNSTSLVLIEFSESKDQVNFETADEYYIDGDYVDWY